MITATIVMVFFVLFLVLLVAGIPAFASLMALLFSEVCYLLVVGWPFWLFLILIVCLCKKGGK